MLSTVQTATKRAALYPRVSTGAQETEGSSLETQEEAMRRYAAERGYAVEHVLTEIHTGTELWERPQLSKLRELVRAGAVDVVIAYSIDRLSRDPVHMGVVVSEAEHHGVDVEFVTEPLDHSPEDQLIRFVRGFAAKVEHEKIRERTVRGRRARAAAGKIHPSGRPKYGYRFNADRSGYEIDPATAAVVRRIKDEVLIGKPLRRVCLDLVADGVPTPARSAIGAWYPSTVRDILTDSFYWGQPRAFRDAVVKERGRVTRTRRPEAEQVALPASVAPPIFTEDEAGAVMARLVANRDQASRRNRDPEASLLRGGYVRCGVCGRAMHFRNPSDGVRADGGRKRRYPHYSCDATRHGAPSDCMQSIGAERLDAAVWERVAAILSRPELIAAELERMGDDEPDEVDTAAVDRLLAGARRQMRALVDQLSRLDPASEVATVVLEKLALLEDTVKRLGAERAAVDARRARHVSKRDRLAGATAFCGRFAASLGTMGYEERRQALYMLDVRVTVWPVGHPECPSDAERYVVDASIPVELPQAAADSVVHLLKWIQGGTAVSHDRSTSPTARAAQVA
jgi:site-specific DNA recombinase